MNKFAAVMLTIVLLFCLGVEVVNAKEMTWNLSGNAVRVYETYGGSTTVWNSKGDSSINGRPRISSLAWSRNESAWLSNTGNNENYCFAQGAQGKEWKNSDQNGRLIWEFSDGSKLFLKLKYEISCTVDTSDGKVLNSENNFGSWKIFWDITGGSGKFAGASGRVEGTGDWIRDWQDLHSRSVSYEGEYTAYLD